MVQYARDGVRSHHDMFQYLHSKPLPVSLPRPSLMAGIRTCVVSHGAAGISRKAGITEMKCSTLVKAFATPLFVFLALSAHAQASSFDVSAGGGLADYFGSGNANRAKGTFEASALYNFGAHIGVGFEYAFSPIDSYNTNYSAPGYSYSQTGTDHLHHFGGVVRFPFAAKAHAEPFGAAHFGGLHESASATVTQNGATASASATANGGYVGAGVGANFFFHGHLGVRPELRYEYLTESGSHLHEMDLTGSIFYRFGGSRK